MDVRGREKLIWLAAAIVTLGSVALVACALAFPPEVTPGAPGSRLGPARTNPGRADALSEGTPDNHRASLDTLARLCATDLRRPLYDPPPPPPPPPPTQAMTVQLVGTISEPGHEMAIFRKSDGTIALCGPGESVADVGGAVMVTNVTQEKVTVTYGNKTHELVVAPRPADGGGS